MSSILNAIGLGFYFIGYLLWLIAVRLNPDNRKRQDKWYGLFSLKQELTAASLIGLVASVLGIAAIFFPVLIIPTFWLFTLSNLCWFIGEYQKTNTYPVNNHIAAHYSVATQKEYFKYVKTVTFISVATAIMTTFGFLFPALFIVFLVVSPYLGGIAAKAWIDVNFNLPHSENASIQTDLTSFPSTDPDNLPPEPSPTQPLWLVAETERKPNQTRVITLQTLSL